MATGVSEIETTEAQPAPEDTEEVQPSSETTADDGRGVAEEAAPTLEPSTPPAPAVEKVDFKKLLETDEQFRREYFGRIGDAAEKKRATERAAEAQALQAQQAEQERQYLQQLGQYRAWEDGQLDAQLKTDPYEGAKLFEQVKNRRLQEDAAWEQATAARTAAVDIQRRETEAYNRAVLRLKTETDTMFGALPTEVQDGLRDRRYPFDQYGGDPIAAMAAAQRDYQAALVAHERAQMQKEFETTIEARVKAELAKQRRSRSRISAAGLHGTMGRFRARRSGMH